MAFRGIVALVCVLVVVARAEAFGPRGHRLIGAVADARLAGTPTAVRVSELLDGMPLAEAALLADEIKAWDDVSPDRLQAFHLREHPRLESQLARFWQANRPGHNSSARPSHHWFHYTDVPVYDFRPYAEGQTGRGRWDVVHMIPFCIRVLSGEIDEANERGITRPVALILLAHLVGDLHQPLHVGAVYFNAERQPTNPDRSRRPYYGTHGGQNLELELGGPGRDSARRGTSLHGYWDSRAVDKAISLMQAEAARSQPRGKRALGDAELARWLAAQPPAGWKPPSGAALEWAEAWANEMLPIAEQAHQRLEFRQVTLTANGRPAARGVAVPREMPDGVKYDAWAASVLQAELPKAGWRLAALLEQILR